ncbi:MAG: diaminopimelate decarboxylase [Clostridia bacterium]|nr:diaminopimelate decarboxylase [Clostridia bacterium]
MFVSDCLGVNEEGHLTIGGCDTVALAKRFGTPLYVMDEDQIRKNCRAFTQSMNEYYDGMGSVCFASKAFCCLEMCRIAFQEGLKLDVCSMGEYYTALKAGVPAKNCRMHGNYKTEEELYFEIETGIGAIIADNIEELERIDRLAGEIGTCPHVLLRVKPGIDAHTHDFVRTGQIDSKFGLALETGEAMEAVKYSLDCKNLNLTGFHSHIGSQIFDIEPFEHNARVMLEFIAKVKEETGFVTQELDLGGGFGIKYTESDNPAPFGEYLKRVSAVIKEKSAELGIIAPEISIEPGRSIVGATGITLYNVGAVKNIPGIRTYVLIDGGMYEDPRYALYKSEYKIVNACRANAPEDSVITLAGRCCESGDLIGENMKVAELKNNDTVAVLSTGAYNFSMASNYNRFARPAVIMIKDGKPRLIVYRQSVQDLIAGDI